MFLKAYFTWLQFDKREESKYNWEMTFLEPPA